VRATKVNAGLTESNGRLLLDIWRDSLHVTCGLTDCTPGSAPGPTLGNEYGKTLPFLSPRGRRDDMPPIDGSSTGGGSASFRGPVRNPYNFGGRQVAGSQRAYSLGWDIQTDGSRYRLMPPLRRRHNNWPLTVIFYACVGRRELKIRVIGQGRCLGLQLARMITRLVRLRSLTEGSSFSSCFERL